jgi:hypothetical protein
MRTTSTPVARTAAGLGLTMATALVIGNMIDSGVFLLPASLGSYGPVSLVAFGLNAVGAMLLMAGIPVYLLMKWRGARETVEPVPVAVLDQAATAAVEPVEAELAGV